jgi:hypothetical protein
VLVHQLGIPLPAFLLYDLAGSALRSAAGLALGVAWHARWISTRWRTRSCARAVFCA